MSTRGSMFYVTHKGITYHAYTDLNVDDVVFIEVQPRRGRGDEVAIPVEVWDGMRQQNPMDWTRTWASKTDAQIRDEVVADVTDRIKQHKAGSKFAALSGFLTYGEVTRPKAKQIADGIRSLTDYRNKCRALVRAAKRIERKAQR
jgi:hypothetical protein